jgi:hypothetical protein
MQCFYIPIIFNKITLFFILLLLPLVVVANKYFIPFGINQFGGEISTRYLKRIEFVNNNKNITTQLSTTAGTSWLNLVRGNVWKQWFGHWSGNTELRLTKLLLQGNQTEKNDSLGISGNTNWTLNLFPVSRFPFTTTLQLAKSLQDSNFQNNESINYSILSTQRYTSPNRKTTVTGSLQFQGINSTNQARNSHQKGVSNLTNLTIEGRHSIGLHKFTGNLNYNILQSDGNSINANNTNDTNNTNNSQLKLYVRHRFNPMNALSIENFTNVFTDMQKHPLSKSNSLNWQINNHTIWHPESEPRLTVNGGARLSGTDARSSNDNGTNSQTSTLHLNLFSGSSFHYTPFLSFNAGVTINMSKTEGSQDINSSQNLSARYSPEKMEWNQFKYRYHVTARANNNISEQDTTQNASVGVGQSISSKFFQQLDSPIVFRKSNNISAIADSVTGSFKTTLTNRISFSHSFNNQGFYASSQLAYNDQFNLTSAKDVKDDEIKNKHSITAFVSGNYRLNRHTSISSNLNVEMNKEKKIDGTKETKYTGSGFISFRDNQLFNVFNLKFSSNISLSLNDFISREEITEDDLLDNKKNKPTNTWENRLTYKLGRFNFISRVTLEQSEEGIDQRIMIEAKRRFGYNR